MPTYKNIKPNELKLLIDEINDLLVIDCRTKEEVDEQSLNYDINIDLYNQADIAKIGTLDSEKSYIKQESYSYLLTKKWDSVLPKKVIVLI